MVIVIETAIIIIILIIIWRIPRYQYLFDILILMITIVTLRFCINLEKHTKYSIIIIVMKILVI